MLRHKKAALFLPPIPESCETRVQNLGITKFGQRQEVLEALAELNANLALIGQLKDEMAHDHTNTDGGSWTVWM